MLKQLIYKNPGISVCAVHDASFAAFGRLVDGYDFSFLLDAMAAHDVPPEGNVYVAHDATLAATGLGEQLSERFYGGMPVQIGYCNGNSGLLNALEYHKGSEIDVAVTDMVLLLGHVWDISHNTYNASLIKAFYLPAGTAVELYATTLHFAPCRTNDAGFKSIVVLPKGTNEALPQLPKPQNDEDALLWMRNKWLIAHPESPQAAKGAKAGITGENIAIQY